MSDRLTGTSNGGATTHAFGVKVQGPDAYGRDRGRDILALSGYPGSFLMLCGQKFNQHGPNDPNYTFNPPTPAEMTELGLEILKRRSKKARKPFAVVIEVESTDNMPNNNNASGTLRALKRADDLIGGARRFLKHRDRKTLIITAADSDGSGIQLLNLTPEDPIPNAPTIGVNSFFNEMGEVEDFRVATDGIEGANTRAFLAEFDAQLPFRPFPNDATDVEPVPDVPLVFSIAFDSIFNAKTFPSGLLTFGPGVIISIYESSVHRPVNWRPHHIFKIYLSDLNPENDRRQAWPDV